jgi:sialic acid synthase SpsE
MNKKITIKGKTIGVGFSPYIIAEMACAHDGIEEKALKLIDAAVAAKVDAVQLQFFVPDETVTPNHPVYDVVKRIAFNNEQWKRIFDHARKSGLAVFVCTYDVPSVKLAVEYGADAIKLNSADLSNPDVLTAVAASGKPFTLGTGASTLDEISNGLNYAAAHGAQNVILMHGVQNFPTLVEDLNISRVELLRDVFDMPVGYHDHTDGDDPFGKIVDLVAIGLGACVIEKHITLDRKEKGIDYQAALEPAEFIPFVQHIHRAYVAYGTRELRPFTESDIRYRKFQKKSVVAAEGIKAGQTINRENVRFIRNVEPGLAPINFPDIEGKKAKRDFQPFENILKHEVE